MRRTLLALALVLALAGCGDKSSSPGADSPLDEALGFLPKDTPAAVAIDTDADGDQWKQVDELLGKFPLIGGQVKQGAKNELEKMGVDFDKDIKPLIGNDAVIGSPGLENGEAEHFVAAIQVKDEGKLDKLLDAQNVKQVGEKDGFKLYEDTDDGDYAGRQGDVVVFADTREVLEGAIDQRGKDDRLREDDFEKGLDGLPDDALVRLSGDLQAVIANQPEAAKARQVPWVAALRSYGLTLSAEDDGVALDMAVHTDPKELTPEDLPIAAGEQAPPIAGGEDQFLIGLRDPAQIVRFAQSVGQIVDPSGYRDFQSKTGIDIQKDLLPQLGGNAQVAVGTDGSFAVRSDLEDPAAFEATLDEITDRLPAVSHGKVGVAKPKAGEEFYALSLERGKTVVYGIVDGKFVLSNKPEQAAAIAKAPTRNLEGAKGSLVFFADARKLVTNALGSQGGTAQLGAQFVTGALRDVTGSVVADTSSVRASFKVGIE